MARMTGGQAVVESLAAQGVDTVFGIISVHTLHLYDALRDAVEAGRMRFVGARHEHALGFMADGYARATGKPGVMLTSSGPGAADSVGALGESFHSSVPLLQITTDIESDWAGRGLGATHEAPRQMDMLASVTGWQSQVKRVDEIPNAIADGMHHLATHHPRPAALTIPTDFLDAEADFEIIPSRAPNGALPDPALVAEAAGLIAGARRPLILAGGGVMSADATAELRELAERFEIPVAVADGGKGAFPDDHPLALGTVLGGRVWGDNPVQAYAGTCDVAVVVGTSLPLRSTAGVGLRLPEKLVQIDIDPTMFGRNYPVRVGLAGNAKSVLRRLLDGLDGSHRPRTGQRAELARLKRETREGLERQFPNELRAWEAIRSAIGRDAVVLSDSTVPGYIAQRCLPVYEPRSYHHPHGWVSIGYSFAASLGAKVGVPDRRVLCITGDGGFQYNLQELGSAVQYGIAPIVVVFNDNAWGVLQRYQRTHFDGRYFVTELANPDFEKLAAAYGIDYWRADSVDGLTSTLRRIGDPATIQLVEVLIPHGFANFT